MSIHAINRSQAIQAALLCLFLAHCPNVSALTCQDVFSGESDAQSTARQRPRSFPSVFWPEQGLRVRERSASVERTGSGEFRYVVDNATYDGKGVSFRQTGLSRGEWEALREFGAFASVGPITRDGDQSAFAVRASDYRPVLEFTAKADQVITLVFESPQSDRNRFELFYNRGYEPFLFPPRQFKFVKARVGADGTIRSLDGKLAFIGSDGANFGRIQAVLVPGLQVDIRFESESKGSNREMLSQWRSDPRSAGLPYSPHITAERYPTQYEGIVGVDGVIRLKKDPSITLDSLLASGRPLESISVPSQQSSAND